MPEGVGVDANNLPSVEPVTTSAKGDKKEENQEGLEQNLGSKEAELKVAEKSGGESFFDKIKTMVGFSDGKENPEGGEKNPDAAKLAQEILEIKLKIKEASAAAKKDEKGKGGGPEVSQKGEITVTRCDMSDPMQAAIADALRGGASLSGLKKMDLSDAAPGATPKAGLEGVTGPEAAKEEGAAR